ncbi:winged helix DNA-binding domain-containing protein [Actinopolymorpha singaporensis]|uniref:Winged helix DNA-binding domain-containing protein n=1 Tax=Actinopolymorpha singaporensis TaxID=117157 RepID=A0A1H1LWB8_9ACTN|nr:winged helix DNA-binding domain-containing protein [Actinopolymorpha singaporensis]SDR78355.1 Winged helix DNA-binding domain-containing protein [Actinopolymorpha singaporensis]
MALEFGRQQVLAYRAAAQGLDRSTDDPAKLGVLDLGVQHSAAHTARLALGARLPRLPEGDADPFADGGAYAMLWSVRGAPHLHRRGDLTHLARALWPRSEADAHSRLAAERKPLKEAGIGALEAFATAARALRTVVTRPMPKGEVSAAVTRKLPDAYAYDCRTCKARHVYGGLLQQVGLPAGVRQEFDTSPPVLAPLEKRPAVPTKPAGTADLVLAYLRLHGPATAGDAASYFGTSQAELRHSWPDGLVEVRADGRKCWLPEEDLAALRGAPVPDHVRLLPPLDPFLQSRDRDLLVPDPARQKEVWKILGNPGVLLVRGDVAGVWRAKAAGRKGLAVTVREFGRISKAERALVTEEADRMAGVRGLTEAAVTYES